MKVRHTLIVLGLASDAPIAAIDGALAAASGLGQTPFVTHALSGTDWASDAPAGFLTWLASLWRDLRDRVADATATKEERELLLLLDFAASRLGDVLLSSTDVDDLDDRLDDQLGQAEIFQWNALAMRLALPTLRREPGRAQALSAAVEPALGVAQVRALEAAMPLLDAYFRAQRAVLSQVTEDATEHAAQTLADIGPSILTSPEVPPELAAAIGGALRAGLCMLAIARAIEQRVVVAPWLAHALVERFVGGVRAHLRLLASIPNANVPESVLPRSERLDLQEIAARHASARERAERTFDLARARLARDA